MGSADVNADTGKKPDHKNQSAPPAIDIANLRLTKPPSASVSFYDRLPELTFKPAYTRIAAGILAALVIGAVIAGTWMSMATSETASSSAPTSFAQTKEPTEPSAVTTQAPELDALGEELAANVALITRYERQILQLNSENDELLSELAMLETETIDLNDELLRLDLTIARLKLIAAEGIEPRTIYNVIDVPIGSAVKDDAVVPYDTTSQITVSGSSVKGDSYSEDGSSIEYDTYIEDNVSSEDSDYGEEEFTGEVEYRSDSTLYQ